MVVTAVQQVGVKPRQGEKMQAYNLVILSEDIALDFSFHFIYISYT